MKFLNVRRTAARSENLQMDECLAQRDGNWPLAQALTLVDRMLDAASTAWPHLSLGKHRRDPPPTTERISVAAASAHAP